MNEVAMLILVCVLANHMGLISAIEEIIKHKIRILNCVKCLTYWTILLYSLFNGKDIITAFATAFLSSYLAIWLELLFGFIDVCYGHIYSKIYQGSTSDNSEESADNADTEDSESKLP